jgi:hypothetical protein
LDDVAVVVLTQFPIKIFPHAQAVKVEPARFPMITLFGLVTLVENALIQIATFDVRLPQPTPNRIPFIRASPPTTSNL